MKHFDKVLKVIHVSLEERLAATRPNIFRNNKRYTRKKKHKNNDG